MSHLIQPRSRRSAFVVPALSLACSALLLDCTPRSAAPPAPSAPSGDWTAYGHDALGSRFSPLTQITRANVRELAAAWTFRTGEIDIPTHRGTRLETTPIVADGMMWISTPLGRLIALDPTNGHERWRYDAHVDAMEDWGDFATRGVSTWVDSTTAPNTACHRRVYLPTIDARIIALDAMTGTPCAGFGDRGTIDLRRGVRTAPTERAEYQLTSPPAIIDGMLVTGSSIADNARADAASGEVRAFDARTGALRWSWDPVPRDSADPAWSSWRGATAHRTGAANAWSVLAVDPARHLVFVPTGSASPDYFGGERLGDNRYANSIVALRASTGRVAWHFQAVHHDLWDYDVPAPPLLATITRGGRRVDVVLQVTKTGQLFVLDRDTGRPVFPVEERPVPASTIPGEVASPTQPFNTALPALSPQRMSLDSVWGASPADRDACRAQLAPLRNEGIYTPPSLEGTLVMPSNVGGAQWGGLAFDPVRQIAIVPVNRIVAMVQLIPNDRIDQAEVVRNAARLGDEYTRMRGTPYVMRRRIVTAPSGLPCSPPPFGSLVAIDLATGRRAWETPLGDVASLTSASPAGGSAPAPAPPSSSPGSPNLGGPIITAGGVVFIGAAIDHAIRAFDVETGRELWKGPLPAGARATPMTYLAGGKQYVVIAVGGNDNWGKGDYLVAFALP